MFGCGTFRWIIRRIGGSNGVVILFNACHKFSIGIAAPQSVYRTPRLTTFQTQDDQLVPYTADLNFWNDVDSSGMEIRTVQHHLIRSLKRLAFIHSVYVNNFTPRVAECKSRKCHVKRNTDLSAV